jgi:alpha-tubulin suppressor-like RCC1 family protein
MRSILPIALLLGPALLGGCSDSEGPAESTYYIVNVPNLLWWMEEGDTEQFEAVAREELDGPWGPDGPPLGPPITDVEFSWSSSDPNVVGIDQTGLAVARGRGHSTIEACALRSCTGWDITVISPITGVALTPSQVRLLPYDWLQLRAMPTRWDGRPDPLLEEWTPAYEALREEFTWSTANAGVARLGDAEWPDMPSLVVAVAAGTTRVTAHFGEFSGSAQVAVVLLDLTEVSAGGDHSCALTDTGNPACWGSGTQTTFQGPEYRYPERRSFVPQQPDEPLSLLSITAGGEHSCGLTADGTAYCWGSNYLGQLGQGSALQPESPVRPMGNRRYTALAAGGGHTCAVATDGQLYCWGSNASGELGVVSEETCGFTYTGGGFGGGGGGWKASALDIPCSRAPAHLTDHPGFVALSAGVRHTCGLMADGTAFCWGAIGSHASPDTLRVPGGHVFAAITSGTSHACGITGGGQAYCWGQNDDGLGDGATTESDDPVAVAGGLTFVSLSAGTLSESAVEHDQTLTAAPTCGVTVDNDLYCWGGPSGGPFGGTTPEQIGVGTAFTSVDVGARHACGMSLAGLALCWGYNDAGQVGVPTDGLVANPVRVVGQQ